MRLNRGSLVLLLSMFLPFSPTAFGLAPQTEEAVPKYDDWLITDKDQIKFKIRVDVFLPDGQPAQEFSVQLQSMNRRVNSAVNIESNQVTAILPLLQYGLPPEMVIATDDGRFQKNVVFPSHEMRKLGAEGMKVTLDSIRMITIRVVDEQKSPVADANVMCGKSSKTDANGIVSIPVAAGTTPPNVYVIAPDGRAGCLKMFLLATDEANASEFEVVLQKGVLQTIKIVDENGNPVPDLLVTPQPMDRTVTAVPEHGYPVVADNHGEAKLTWLPTPPGVRAFISVSSNDWQVVNEQRTDDLWKVNIKPLPRQRIAGTVKIPAGIEGGFLVQLTSFDHPTPRRADQVFARTDEQGTFSANVLPGATYCVYGVDSEWSSSFWDGVIVEEDGTINRPELTISRGLPVQITATAGPEKLPMTNTAIDISRKHAFQGNEGGGISGPSWIVTTDQKGVATVFASPGELEASIYSPDYNDSKKLVVTEGGKNEIRFHRKSVETQSVSGKLIRPENSDILLSGAQVFLETSDGKTQMSRSTQTTEDGEFELRSMGERFAIFVLTADKKASGQAFCDMEEAKSLRIPLTETAPYRGRLLDESDKPIANCTVTLLVTLTDPLAEDLRFFQSAKTMTQLVTTTKPNGVFVFDTTPVEIPFVLRLDDPRITDDNIRYLGKRILLPDDSRPPETFRVGYVPPTANSKSIMNLDERLDKLFFYCKAIHSNVLIVVPGSSERATDFVSGGVFDSEKDKSILWYLPLVMSQESLRRDDVQQSFADRNWSVPDQDNVVMIALDANGVELGRLNINTDSQTANENAQTFVEKHRGETYDAKQKMDAAMKLAKESGRKILVTTGHSRCGPCVQLAGWMNIQRELLEKDYVLLKIDSARDENGIEISNKITRGKNHGVPFFAILDHDSSIIVDSAGPLGNIGFPGGSYEGQYHFRKMLNQTASSLTESEIETLITSLDE